MEKKATIVDNNSEKKYDELIDFEVLGHLKKIPDAAPKQGFVYFIYRPDIVGEEEIKFNINCVKDLKQRMTLLQLGSPEKLVVYRAILHEDYKHHYNQIYEKIKNKVIVLPSGPTSWYKMTYQQLSNIIAELGLESFCKKIDY